MNIPDITTDAATLGHLGGAWHRRVRRAGGGVARTPHAAGGSAGVRAAWPSAAVDTPRAAAAGARADRDGLGLGYAVFHPAARGELRQNPRRRLPASGHRVGRVAEHAARRRRFRFRQTKKTHARPARGQGVAVAFRADCCSTRCESALSRFLPGPSRSWWTRTT